MLKDATPDQLLAAVRAAVGNALIDALVAKRFIAHLTRAVRPAGSTADGLNTLTGVGSTSYAC
jgi:hypothetical protein